MGSTKMRAMLVVLLTLILVGAVFPAAQPAEAQTPTITMVGLPDADPMSGRFINVTRGMDSLGDVGEEGNIVNISLEVSPALSEFALWIFDGDMGELWDRWEEPSVGMASYPFDDVEFVLFRDPQAVGNTNSADQIALWSGLSMPDDDWFQVMVNQDAGAFNAERGVFIYHLVCRWVITNDWHDEQNNFKVAVQGQPFLRAGSTVGFEGFNYVYGPNVTSVQWTKYDGTFTFHFMLPEATPSGPIRVIDIWEGDADRWDDTEDVNSPSFPTFQYSPYTLPEGNNPGLPPDDNTAWPWAISPNVQFVVVAPDSLWTVTNENPSGNSEWELFRIGLSGELDIDVVVSSLPSGVYTWYFQGLDSLNTMFLHLKYDLYTSPPPPPPPPPPGTGTPGYWKNHPEAWPVESITIGGVTYDKAQAITIMKTNKAKDKTYTMFAALVCAKLNLLLGNESSCIALTVLDADQWMKKYGPVGSGIKASSQAWKEGEPLYLKLDDYNNGLLCAPHRD
ncbi:MAG: hypothetical protein H5T68_11010 [Chloroflexi bacterium]|nr:hypothetical protein [Chloroflexota bacterium]